jgi:hypothetical protein
MLFPIFTFLFLVGFVAYVYADTNKQKTDVQQENKPQKTPNPAYYFETGLVAEQDEEQLVEQN